MKCLLMKMDLYPKWFNPSSKRKKRNNLPKNKLEKYSRLLMRIIKIFYLDFKAILIV